MTKKIIAGITLVLSITAVAGVVIFANPKISSEKKNLYETKKAEENKENEAIGKEKIKIAEMTNGAEKDKKQQALNDREIKYKNESLKNMQNAVSDSYIDSEDVIDSNAKLTKKLEDLKTMFEWDIKNAASKKESDFEIKNLEKVVKLLNKVKASDESKFTDLYTEFNSMTYNFKTDREAYNKDNSK